MKNASLGARIRAARMSAGLTQKQFSELAQLSQPAISFYERDVAAPSMDSLERIAKATQVSVEWLIGTAEESDNQPEQKQYLLYKIFYEDKLVYIGRTAQPLKKRLYGHFSKAPMMRQLDVRRVTKIEYATFKTEADMFLYEIYFINKWKPVLNRDDKSNEPLTIELPPVTFTEYVCDLLPKWKEIVEKKDRDFREQKQNRLHLEALRREKRKEIFESSDLSPEQKSEQFGRWIDAVYAPKLAEITGEIDGFF